MQREDHALTASPVSSGGGWDLNPETTLTRLLALNARTHGARVAMREKALGIWQEFTWAEVLDEVLAVAAGLEQMGFAPAIRCWSWATTGLGCTWACWL